MREVDLSKPAETSAAAEEVCARLSVEGLKQILPMSPRSYEDPIRLRREPLPVHPIPDLTQVGCTYKDGEEKVWLLDAFVPSEQSVKEIIEKEIRTEGFRAWVPVEVEGYNGYYTPGAHGLGYTNELILQIEDGLNFHLVPYKSAAAPRASPSAPQAPAWIQGVAEELAARILR